MGIEIDFDNIDLSGLSDLFPEDYTFGDLSEDITDEEMRTYFYEYRLDNKLNDLGLTRDDIDPAFLDYNNGAAFNEFWQTEKIKQLRAKRKEINNLYAANKDAFGVAFGALETDEQLNFFMIGLKQKTLQGRNI